jgi:hypothetical protein
MEKCLKCKEREPIEYEDIGEGKFCQSCLDEEMEIWKKEAGFEQDETEILQTDAQIGSAYWEGRL